MIKSITFPEEGTGYIYERIDEPIKPDRSCRPYHKMDSKEFAKEIGKWRSAHNKWEKIKDQYKLQDCHNNLAGKTFTFEKDKVNVIFGPNGSGKSTILKAIAGNALCTDGLSRIFDPLDFKNVELGRDFKLEDVVQYANMLKKNSCDIVWDGAPIYYDNFAETEKEGYVTIGGLAGDLMSDLSEEIAYRQGVGRISTGQKGIYLLTKILTLSKNIRSMKEIIEGKAGSFDHYNSVWKTNRLSQIEYFKQFEKYSERVPYTFLFDELDKSLDIPSVYRIYTEFFPDFIKINGCQIITVSHNPLILSDKIFDSPAYNVISVDEKYTEGAKNLLSEQVKF